MIMNRAILACGCFWGVEKLFKNLSGVINTQVGYIGGTTKNPTYEEVCTINNGHFEAIEISFDSNELSFQEILKYFFQIHDPTQIDGQHNDIGHQYKSAIFYLNDEQKIEGENFLKQLAIHNIFNKPIATVLLKASTFYKAEEYHQDYLEKKPDGYMCHLYKKIDFPF